MTRPVRVLSFLGTKLDRSPLERRWDRWRPNVALGMHDDLLVRRVDLLTDKSSKDLADTITGDLASVSPETDVIHHQLPFSDPWDFEEVFSALLDLSRDLDVDPAEEDLLVHITTGTHVCQICLFLLVESRFLPGRLLQTSPARRGHGGSYRIIDLDLARYDGLARRFETETQEARSFLKSGIETHNERFNRLIEQIEHVAIRSRDPILLTGPTGAGKSRLARKIHELKRSRRQVEGRFVEVNCATIRGDGAMSALFGHRAGAFTGAVKARAGLLKEADGGLLFLDEIGELGVDEQAMLLRALEEKTFLPLGSDREVQSDFQLLAGTNRHLADAVREGRFREDLLARINLWTFDLPSLRDRPEDIEPNLDYELERYSSESGRRITFNREARRGFQSFATSAAATWAGNFRDLNAAVRRMGTLAPGGRIDRDTVDAEIARLESSWTATSSGQSSAGAKILESALGAEGVAQLDRFERSQLEDVVACCADSRTLSEAGRELFAVSRERRRVTNDADRLRKYLAKFGLDFRQLRAAAGETS